MPTYDKTSILAGLTPNTAAGPIWTVDQRPHVLGSPVYSNHTIPAPAPAPLVIHTAHGNIVINHETGEVSLPPGMPISSGAREFWERLPGMYGVAIQKKAMEQADALFAGRWEQTLKTAFPKVLAEEIDRTKRALLAKVEKAMQTTAGDRAAMQENSLAFMQGWMAALGRVRSMLWRG